MSAQPPKGSAIPRNLLATPGQKSKQGPAAEKENQSNANLLSELNSDETRFHIGKLKPISLPYYAVLLFLPFFYSSRVYPLVRVVKEAEEEFKAYFSRQNLDDPFTHIHWPRTKSAWTDFLNSVNNEWKTLNIVSALLLSAIYNVLQLGGYGNRFIQCTALMSLFSALMSLIFGCLYLIRFETMRQPYKAMQWGRDVLDSSGTVLWNTYVVLALPSVWLAWSLILFVVCLMSIIWQPQAQTISGTSGLGPIPLAVKIAVSVVFLLGMVHLFFVLITFSRYGSKLDKTWSERLGGFIEEGNHERGDVRLAIPAVNGGWGTHFSNVGNSNSNNFVNIAGERPHFGSF